MKIIVIASSILVVLIATFLLIRNIKNNKTIKLFESLQVRFNSIKSAPIAFKLSKAQTLAKRNQDTVDEVNEYYNRYENAQRIIDDIQEKINDISEEILYKNYKKAKELSLKLVPIVANAEKEINEIDVFLNRFQQEENNEREFSQKLKESFRDVKQKINYLGNNIAYCEDGILTKTKQIEDLFSSSEEWLYANEYEKADDILLEINNLVDNLNNMVDILPELIGLIKGILPRLIEEIINKKDLTIQRGINLSKMNIDSTLEKLSENINAYQKLLRRCEIDDLTNKASEDKEKMVSILNDLDKENEAYDNIKTILNKLMTNLDDLNSVYEYVSKSYKDNKARFGLNNLDEYLNNEADKIKKYSKKKEEYESLLYEGKMTCFDLLEKVNELYNESEIERKSLLSYKMKIDQTTFDEEHAYKQLQKLQVVVNEVETKVKEYRLPSIDESYYKDLDKCKEYIKSIKKLLKEIPIDMEKLNEILKEAIDFIYAFFNDVNNIVGMAIMVENAIVFGNKYRSTYPEVDYELNKAEFSYINGEYTKALKIAINCMETLFPNVKDKEILSND